MRLLPVLLSCGLILNIYAKDYNEYSDGYARKMLSMSAAAYSADAKATSNCLKKEFPDSAYRLRTIKENVCDDKGNTCALFTAVSSKDKKIIIAFRGTVGDAQLKLETAESLKPDIDWYGYGLVDRYFYNAIGQLWPFVLPVLNETSSSHWEVQFTGYSLGGALATLAAMKTHALGLREPEKIKLLTFGEPRVGNAVFANNVDRVVNDAVRVVHKGDLVPHLPPCKDSRYDRRGCDRHDLRRAYHHGTEVWYNNAMMEEDSYKICTADNEDPDCSDGMGKWEAVDHLHYFGHLVSAYGPSGCNYTEPLKKSSKQSSPLSSLVVLSMIIRMLNLCGYF